MKELTKRKKIIGTIETVLAAAVIIIAVVTAPKLSAQKEETSAAASETAAATQAVTETEQEKTEPTTSSVGIGVQPIGEYSLNGYIVVTGDAAMERYSIASTKLKEYAASANNLASKIPSSKVYVMLAPTRMEFYGPEEYRTGSHSQQMGMSTAYLALNPEVTGVDAYSEIARHTDEYEYFRTDHHWTARGAYYAYKAFCESAGLTCTPLDSFQSGKLDDFVGSMYRYTQSENLKKNPDYVEYFLPRYDVSAESFSTADMTDGKPLRVRTLHILGAHALNIGVPAHAPQGAGSLDCIRTVAFGQKPAGGDGCRSAKDGKRRAAKGGHQGQTPLRLRLPQPLFSVY